MFRLACIAAAAALLSACATLTPSGLHASYASFDEGAPVEPPVFHPARGSLHNLGSLNRRSFGPPLRRQPDFRAVAVTAADRSRRRVLPRSRRRANA